MRQIDNNKPRDRDAKAHPDRLHYAAKILSGVDGTKYYALHTSTRSVESIEMLVVCFEKSKSTHHALDKTIESALRRKVKERAQAIV